MISIKIPSLEILIVIFLPQLELSVLVRDETQLISFDMVHLLFLGIPIFVACIESINQIRLRSASNFRVLFNFSADFERKFLHYICECE